MNSILQKGYDFLKSYGMDPDQFDIEQGCTLFIDEMEKGLKGTESSLMMLPTYIDAEGNIPYDEPVLVLDAGGTNFRAATITFTKNGNPQIDNYKKFPMPGTGNNKIVGKKEFFDTIAGYMKDIVETSSKIGFCFSYPTEMLPTGDGKLITFTKEVKAPEVEGSVIGENLKMALVRAGFNAEKEIVILNDTVAALLASKTGNTGKKFDSYIGFILGTGTNCSYIEKNVNIRKIKDIDKERKQIINMESGKFSLFEGGSIDKEFISTTDKPEESKYEKMISGAYQGPLALTVLKKAVADNLFSPELTSGIINLDTLETKTMDGFLHTPFDTKNILSGLCLTENDRILMFTILDRLIERAAKLTAAQLAAVVMKTEKGKDPTQPVCIAADGTTYYKTKGLKFRTEYYLKDFLINKKQRFVEFTHREDAPLIGAAVAGLLQ